MSIGSSSLKVGEIVDTKKGLTLRNFGMANIPPGAIEEGIIKEPEVVAVPLPHPNGRRLPYGAAAGK